MEREKRKVDAAIQRERQQEERARRAAERRAQASAKEREQLAHETAAAEATERTEEINAKVGQLETILDTANPAPFHFGDLRQPVRIQRFNLARFGTPAQTPDWQDFAPEGPPRGLAAKFGGRARYEQALEEGRRRYQEALDAARRTEATRQNQIRQAREEHQRRADVARAAVDRHNQAVDLFEAAYWAGDADAVEDFVGQVLNRSQYPPGFPTRRRLAYRPEPHELWIEFQLPSSDIVPPERSFRYVKTRKATDTQLRAKQDRDRLYTSVVAQTALRILREIFETTPAELIDSVALNGHVDTHDPATGQPVYPCLITVSVSRAAYLELNFNDHLKPIDCLKRLKVIMSPHPYDIVAVTPIVDFDLSRYKFVDDFDAAAGLDSRPDLLDMDPYAFEHLIRQLFEKIGMKGWAKTTQGSRDQGVDVVVTDPNPITGGICVIQAKLYKGVVSTEAVRALWGTVEEQHATKGILVTTAWFGPASREFAAKRLGRIRLIEGDELKGLLEEHLDRKVRIGLPKPPPPRRSRGT